MKPMKKIKITTSNPPETNYVEATDFYIQDSILHLYKNNEMIGGFGFPLNFVVVEEEENKSTKEEEKPSRRSFKCDLINTINEFIDEVINDENISIRTSTLKNDKRLITTNCCKTSLINKEKLLIKLNNVLQSRYKLTSPPINQILPAEGVIDFGNKLYELIIIKKNSEIDINDKNVELNLLNELAEIIIHRLITFKEYIRYHVTSFLKENCHTYPTKEELIKYCEMYGNITLLEYNNTQKQKLNKSVNYYVYLYQTPETARKLIDEITDVLYSLVPLDKMFIK